MSYQRCPKCDGTGEKFKLIPESFPYGAAINAIQNAGYPYRDKDGILKWRKPDNICLVCEGKMIISTLTGKPPGN